MTDHLVCCRRAALAALCLIFTCGVAAADLEVFVVDPAFSPYNVAGQSATIKGIGFTPSTTVDFNGTPGAVTFVDSRTLVVTVPTFGSDTFSTVTVSDPSNGSDQFYPFLHTDLVYYVSTSGSDTNNGTSPSTPFRTLFKAMDVTDAVTATEVRVEAGVYLEADTPVWNGVALSCGWATGFGSRDPDAHITVIDAQNTGFVARSAGLASAQVIDGCTLTNGFRDGLGGGGVAISADSMVINNSVIVGNTSSSMGGGVYFILSTTYGGISTISNSVILGNRAHNKNGGGIVIYPNYNTQQPVRVNVTGNEIVGNRSFNGRGGGLALATSSYAGYNNGVLKVADNIIAHNRARSGGGGSVTFFTFGDLYDVSMKNNLFMDNTAVGSGGGFAFEGAGLVDGEISSNSFEGNAATQGLTGGLLIDGAMTLLPGFEARDSVFWDNVGDDVGGQAIGVLTFSDAGVLLPGAGNISQNPAFASGPLGSHYLTQSDPNQSDSPALDSGSALASDLSLEVLITDPGGLTDSGVADMGFHYPQAAGNSPSPLSISRVDPARGDLSGSEWVLIRGDGFDPGAGVSFDGVPASSVRFLDNRRLLVQPAPHALGPVDMRVTNPDTSFIDANSIYEYVDNHPPEWTTTVGLVSAVGGQDCVRSAVLQWNPATDLTSPPVIYEIYREQCDPSGNTSVPCNNFGYFPSATNLLGTSFDTFYTDAAFSASGADNDWIYVVRARDAAVPPNKEYNFARRMITVGTTPGDTTPPPEIGENLEWVGLSVTDLDWPSRVGANRYGLYREGSATPFGDPNLITPFLVLDSANNDNDGDGVVDSAYVENDVPAADQAFFYRVTAIDPCGNETISDLLP